MITLIRNNVVKIVDSEEKAEKLKAKGFELLSNPSESDDTIFSCPFCDKTYKTQKGLEEHILKVHPDCGGGNNGTDSGEDSTGSPE